MRPPAAEYLDAPIVAEVREFSERHHLVDRSRVADRSGQFPRAEFRAMGAAQLLGLHFSPSHGGRGLPLATVGPALFALAEASGTSFAKLSLQPEFCSVLAEQASSAVRDRYFGPLMRGELLVGNQITEPGAGSDMRALASTAIPTGETYLLNGSKVGAAFATEAEAAIVYARAPGGPTAFLVPQDLPGVHRVREDDLGERWMGRGRVEYREVRVPKEMRLGDEGRGFDYLGGELHRERLLLAAVYLGVARSAWSDTVRFVGERAAFGQSLWKHEAVGFPLVEDWARLDAAWAYVRSALERFDRGENVEAAAALAKWYGLDVALATIDHAIQFHGGPGYSEELPFAQMWRDVRSGAIAHGTSEIMHMVAARRLWPKESETRPPA